MKVNKVGINIKGIAFVVVLFGIMGCVVIAGPIYAASGDIR